MGHVKTRGSEKDKEHDKIGEAKLERSTNPEQFFDIIINLLHTLGGVEIDQSLHIFKDRFLKELAQRVNFSTQPWKNSSLMESS